MDYDILFAFITACFALAIAPGPDNIFVLTLSLANGTIKGLAVVAGLLSGCLVHTTVVAFGVSALLQTNATLFTALKLLGACYLLYLAYLVFKNKAEINLSQTQSKNAALGQLYRKGFLMNILNPKVTIFFLAFFPAFLFSTILDERLQFYVLGFLFILVSGVVFGAIAFCAGVISRYLGNTPNMCVFFKWLQITVFFAIALYLVLG